MRRGQALRTARGPRRRSGSDSISPLTADKDLGPIAPEASATIAEVIARMEQIDAELSRKDGVAYFNRLYLQVTKAVQTATSGVTFEDPDFTEAARCCLRRPLLHGRGNDRQRRTMSDCLAPARR